MTMSRGKRSGKAGATHYDMILEKKAIEEKKRIEKRCETAKRMEGIKLEEVGEVHENRNQGMKEEKAIDRIWEVYVS